ncbi:acyltransferase domain-containing protein [Nonomuraea sp. NPDC050310]|uniref:acyltransferase domain-containing protein n=1 Tax=Nonomuraea sp. NPDC050310 TaxID=3154935 RepID=UPI0033EC761E
MKDRDLTTAALFPGQGAFDGTALLAAAERHPEVGDVFAEIDAVTAAVAGRKLSAIVLGTTPATMEGLLADEPWVSQLAIYGMGVAVHRVLTGAGWRPDVLAGHSLGEIGALVCAGAYTVEDGARLIWARVDAIGGLDLRGGYMAALATGAGRARQLVAFVGDESLAVAAENHAAQTVVSGSGAAMETVRGVAGAINVSFARLAASVPFHCPLLEPAAARFAAAIRDIPQREPHTPVYSPIYHRFYEPGENLGDLLAGHFVAPVRFAEAAHALHAAGARVFVECGALETTGKLILRNLGTDGITVVAGLPAGARSAEPAVARLRELGLLDTARLDTARLDTEPAQPAVPAGLLPGVDAAAFAAFWAARGRGVLDHIRREFEEYGAAVPAGDLDRELRELYADALEYPVEVFTDDVLLEAELGIDSVKQVELLTRVSERYGLPARPGSFRLDEVATMGKVIAYVRSVAHESAGR